MTTENQADRKLADALLVWFDKTHGNSFGHDHHCPVPEDFNNPYASHPRDAECTCGWTAVVQAARERA